MSSCNNDEIAEKTMDTIATKLRRLNISTFKHTFESFKPTNETKEAVAILKEISNEKTNIQFVLLYGTTGSGKTHLIEASIISWAKQGLFTRYQTFSEIARSLKSALRQSAELYDELFKRYQATTRLVVDDIGSGTTESRFEISDLEDIIDQRYRRRYYPDENLITILSTNKDIKDLPDRIVSRFYDPEFGKVIYTGEEDYRRSKERKLRNDMSSK